MSCCGNGKLVTFELEDNRLITVDLDYDCEWGDIDIHIDSDTNKPVIQIGNDEDGYVKVHRCFAGGEPKEDFIGFNYGTYHLVDNLKVIEWVLVRMLYFCDGYTMNDLKSSLEEYGIDINKVDIPKDWINE